MLADTLDPGGNRSRSGSRTAHEHQSGRVRGILFLEIKDKRQVHYARFQWRFDGDRVKSK